MAEGANNPQFQPTNKVLMYDDPRPLRYDTHGKLGVTMQEGAFDFLKNIHYVPLTANEFGVAASHYPIIFAGPDHMPLAVMGMRQGDNLFVDENNQFKQDAYVPAYVRRYPFVLAASQEGTGDRMLVCVDHACSAIKENPDQAFFKDENEPSAYTQQAIEFLQQYESQRKGTEQMMSRLAELDLFYTRDVTYRPQMRGRPGAEQKVTEHVALDEKKLTQLDEKTLKELMESGIIGAAYAHLLSMFRWDQLLEMEIRRQRGAENGKAPSADVPTDKSPAIKPKGKGGKS